MSLYFDSALRGLVISGGITPILLLLSDTVALVLKTLSIRGKKVIATSLILLMMALVSTPTPVQAQRTIKVEKPGQSFPVYEGDTVVTGPKTTGFIRFVDGSMVTLKQSTTFVIKKIEKKIEPGIQKIESWFHSWKVERGGIWARNGEWREGYSKSRIRCATEEIRCDSIHTEFTIDVDENKVTTVAVLEGEVEVQDLTSNSTVIVDANQMIAVPQVPGGLSEQDMQQRITAVDPKSMERWWEKAILVATLKTGGDADWLPDGKLNYTYVWPLDPSSWWVSGRSMYEMTISVKEKVYIDFNFTYIVNEDAQIEVWIANKIPLGTLGDKGWLLQFDLVNPPTSNVGTIQSIDQGPLVGAGYRWSQPMKSGDQLVIKGRLVMVNENATDLSAQGLAVTKQYINSYMPIADFIIEGNQTLIPGMDIWGALGIPLSKSTLDTIRAMGQQEVSFNQEKAKLQTQISDVQKTLSSTQEQVKTIQSDLKSAQDNIKSLQAGKTTIQDKVTSLEKDNSGLKLQVSSLEKDSSALKTQITNLEKDKASLQGEISTKQSNIDSLQSQLSQSQTMIYGSISAALVLLIAATVLAVRKRK